MLSKLIPFPRLPYRDDKLFGLIFVSLFLVPLFFIPLLQDAFDFPRLTLLAIFIGSLLLVLARNFNNQPRISFALMSSLVAFLILNITATAHSQIVLNSILGYHQRHSNSLLFVLLWTIFVFLICYVNTQEKLLTLSKVFVWSGILVAGLGILHSFSIGYYTGFNPGPRPITPGFIGNQNFSAMFLVGVIPFLLPLSVKAKKNLHKILYAVVGFLMIWALMVFASRGSIIAILGAGLVGITLLLIRKFSWRVNLGVLLALVLTIVLAIFFYSSSRIAGVDTSLDLSTDQNTQSRLVIWTDTVDLIKMHPWTGVGQGNFYSAINGLGDPALVGTERFNDAHNIFLNIATTTGIPALVTFLGIMAVALYYAFKNFWKDKSLMGWAIFVAIVAVLISASFNPVSVSSWVMLAFLLASSQFAIRPKPVLAFVDYSWYKKTFLIFGGTVFIIMGIALLSSEFVSKFGIDSYRAGQYETSIQYGKYARLLNPFNSYPNVYIAASMIRLQQDPRAVREKINVVVNGYENSATNLQWAAILSLMLHNYSADEQDLKSLYSYLDKQQQAEPNYGPSLINAGFYAYKAHNFELATKYLNHALAADRQNKYSYGYLLLAEVQLEQGQLDLMYKSLQRAYEISPNPGFKTLFDDYLGGNFKAKVLPIGYPPIDI